MWKNLRLAATVFGNAEVVPVVVLGTVLTTISSDGIDMNSTSLSKNSSDNIKSKLETFKLAENKNYNKYSIN